jgi:thiamine pyrophosphate-dependent acetolactate synthase large subunit-like protein
VSDVHDAVQSAAQELCAARRPAILVGPEGAPVAPLIVQIADRLGAALLTTPDALSVIDSRRSCGTFSFGASAVARRAMERADVVLAISALGEFSCRLGEAFQGKKLIQVRERVTGVGRNLSPAITLAGSAIQETLERLSLRLAELTPDARGPWYGTLTEGLSAAPTGPARLGYIHPGAAISAIEAALPEAARVCIDITSGALHAYQQLELTPSQRAFSSIENGACMGEALMASLGIRLASDLPTLTIVGDWGYCMAPSEIHTAVELELDRYVVLIWANGGGAFIGTGVEQQGIVVPDRVWRWSSPPDFAQVARGYGARGVRVTNAEALQRELCRALRAPGPVIIEAKIDPTVPVPAGDRFLSLGEARA